MHRTVPDTKVMIQPGTKKLFGNSQSTAAAPELRLGVLRLLCCNGAKCVMQFTTILIFPSITPCRNHNRSASFATMQISKQLLKQKSHSYSKWLF
uniref:Uncharacterized protein n=1 Tax=Candidatus Kentrum sp. FW TaxID=2126338 RepID=A0A450TIX6_9GAMM|nr:MAG: hypothetical protein BECKFW1821C_GA0114237_101151 [Candidatus Kentron sp. FW]